MDDCDLSLEKSEANGIIYSSVDSIKNFYKGKIKVLGVQEIIKNDPNARGEIIVFEE